MESAPICVRGLDQVMRLDWFEMVRAGRCDGCDLREALREFYDLWIAAVC